MATQHDETSGNRYAELRRRDHSYGRALRTVPDCCRSPAPCSSSKPCSTLPTKLGRPTPREKVVWVVFCHLAVVSGGVAGEAPALSRLTIG